MIVVYVLSYLSTVGLAMFVVDVDYIGSSMDAVSCNVYQSIDVSSAADQHTSLTTDMYYI